MMSSLPPAAAGIEGPQRRVDETAVGHDRRVVEAHPAARAEDLHEVPVDRRAVAVVAPAVGVPERKVDRPEDLLVEEDVAHRPGDARVEAEGELAEIAGAGVDVEDPPEPLLAVGGRAGDGPAAAERQPDVVEGLAAVNRRAV